MTARTRRRAHYRACLSAPATREAAVAQAGAQHLADLRPANRLAWDDDLRAWVWQQQVGDVWADAHTYPTLQAFAEAQALDIPATAGEGAPA